MIFNQIFVLIALTGTECTGGVDVDNGNNLITLPLADGVNNEQACRSYCQTPVALVNGFSLETVNGGVHADLFNALTTMGMTCVCYSFTPPLINDAMCRLTIATLEEACTSVQLGPEQDLDNLVPSNMAVFDCRKLMFI